MGFYIARSVNTTCAAVGVPLADVVMLRNARVSGCSAAPRSSKTCAVTNVVPLTVMDGVHTADCAVGAAVPSAQRTV